MPAPMGTTVCIPERCDIYTVQPNDTRTSIIRTVSEEFTVTQLQTGILISISSVGTGTVWTAQLYASAPLAVGWIPPTVPAHPRPRQLRQCQLMVHKELTVTKENTILSKMAISVHLFIQMDISLNDFYFLHLEIDANCTNLMLGIAYCVETVGDIPMYVNYTDSCAAIESEFGITFAQFTAGTMRSGRLRIPADRNTYCVAGPSRATSCWSIEQAYGIRADDFVSWNPAVGEDCSGLWLGYSYCVGV